MRIMKNIQLFSISVNSYGEGSWVDIYLPEQENINYSTEIKEKIELFIKKLYQEIDKQCKNVKNRKKRLFFINI